MIIYSIKMTKVTPEGLVEMALRSDDDAEKVITYLMSQPDNGQVREALVRLARYPEMMRFNVVRSKCIDMLRKIAEKPTLSDSDITMVQTIITTQLSPEDISRMFSVLASDKRRMVSAIIFMVDGPNLFLILAIMSECGLGKSASYPQVVQGNLLVEAVKWLSENRGVKWNNSTSGGAVAKCAMEGMGWVGNNNVERLVKNTSLPDKLSEAILDPVGFASQNRLGAPGHTLIPPPKELRKYVWDSKMSDVSSFNMAVALLEQLRHSEDWIELYTDQERFGVCMRIIQSLLTNPSVQDVDKIRFVKWLIDNPPHVMGADGATDYAVSLDPKVTDLVLDEVLTKDLPKAISRVTRNLDYSIPRYERIARLLRSANNWNKADHKFVAFVEAIESAASEAESDLEVEEFERLSWYSKSSMVKEAMFGLSEKQQAVLLVFLAMIVGIPIMTAMHAFDVSGQDMVDNASLKRKAEIVALEKDLVEIKAQVQKEIQEAEMKALSQPSNVEQHKQARPFASCEVTDELVNTIVTMEHDPLRGTSSSGAAGLMQIMRPTWDELNRKHFGGKYPWQTYRFNNKINKMFGRRYLKDLKGLLDANKDKWQADELPLLIASYFSGFGNVQKHDFNPATIKTYLPKTYDYMTRGSNIMGYDEIAML